METSRDQQNAENQGICANHESNDQPTGWKNILSPGTMDRNPLKPGIHFFRISRHGRISASIPRVPVRMFHPYQ
jgi:hypothetical protein